MTDVADLEVAARAPLVSAPPTACRQKIRPGEVIRVPARLDPLIGYHMACAKCGYPAAYTSRDTTYVEERIVASQSFPRRLVDIINPPRCYQCRHLIAIRDSHIVALVPADLPRATPRPAAGSLAAAAAAVAALRPGRSPP